MTSVKEVKQLTRSCSHLLKRAVQYSIHLYMEEAGKTGLTHRQFIVLAAVDAHDGKSQTELVAMTGIDRSTLADLVARLLAQGYLQRKRSKEDARTNTIRLTPIGKKMLKQAQTGAEEVDRRLMAILPAADRRALIDNLAAIATEMDKLEDDEAPSDLRSVRPRRIK